MLPNFAFFCCFYPLQISRTIDRHPSLWHLKNWGRIVGPQSQSGWRVQLQSGTQNFQKPTSPLGKGLEVLVPFRAMAKHMCTDVYNARRPTMFPQTVIEDLLF